MAIAFLNEGATSLATGNWSDGIGFADNATLVIDKIFGSGSPVITSVDQSALLTGIDYLDIHKGAIGQLGTGASPLQVDADTAAGDGISNHGNVTLYFKGGGSNVINNFDCGVGSRNFATGGTIGQTTAQGGLFDANESTILTNFDAYGGTGEIAYNATKITLCRITRGKWIIRRPGVYEVSGTAHVVFDLDDASVMTGSSLDVAGGNVNVINGAFPTMVATGGVVDLSKARRAFTIGSISVTLGGTQIIEGNGLVTISNVTNVGNSKRSIGGYSPAP